MSDGERRGAVVTGASAGVGRAVALELAAEGFDVGLIARGEEGLAEVARAVERRGVRAMVLVCDVADAGAVEAAAERAAAAFGGLDVWVNCAMVTVFSPFDEMSAEEFDRVTQVTYLGQVNGTRAALKRMRAEDRGSIVQVGSALAYRSIPLQSAYCGAKHAIVGFTESLRTELLHEGSGIEVAMVHLPAVNTPQFAWARSRIGVAPRPAGRPVTPEVAARTIVGAALHPRREVYLGWGTAEAILGNAAAPRFADRLAARTWDGQRTETPMEDRDGNLFAPVAGVRRDRGPFSAEARRRALAMTGRQARSGVALVAAAGVGLAAALAWAVGRESRPEPVTKRLRASVPRLSSAKRGGWLS